VRQHVTKSPQRVHKSEGRKHEPQEFRQKSHVSLFSHVFSRCEASNGIRVSAAKNRPCCETFVFVRGSWLKRCLRRASEGLDDPKVGSPTALVDQHLPQAAGVRVRDDEADIGRNRSDVGNVIANSFELQKDRSHDQSPQRNVHLSRPFNGLTESCAMGKTRIP